MNYKEIIDLTYNVIDEVDFDEQIEIIVKEAINEAYLDLAKIDKRVEIAYLPIIRKIATLPENCVSVIETTPPLTSGDKIIGNTIITTQTGMFETIYATAREILINDTDTPDLHISLHPNLANFACYKYFLHRKKVEIAEAFLNKYMIEVNRFEKMINDMACNVDAVIIEY